ncbi:MAG: Heat shock protein FtsJ/RrmJ @ Ribosomal RNA large subunit methyltransferase E (EC [uncultured Thiotrichaceae bacterium]|uniref:Ribosomal RNA large subunit methyltransferase E n=1 Tax=uncultured Thiotrichaceae bacterium TaxID=298394 RepID=A0A6S6SHY1_9GAMM|nr:MAG: Heat shock protein FtsJ/RrmJ @ Ribosomal RNA large subunit methyltransferase E (EC [uncultured Thiotrichaceae bacterium]
MARSKSSQRWLREHFDDEYVKKSQKDGYRSRAIYKLKEIQDKDRIIQPGHTVVDLGAAPGGWSQYATELVGEKKGRVIASDILPIDPLPFVEFLVGDFREESVLKELLDLLGEDKADLVISDMAPNISGMEGVDQPRSIYLCELALDMARQVLKPNGTFVVKLFQGQGSDDFLNDVRRHFKRVKIRKPSASRPRSREVYVLAQGFMV